MPCIETLEARLVISATVPGALTVRGGTALNELGGRSLIVTHGGKIVEVTQSGLSRFNPDGSVDVTFGTQGTAAFPGLDFLSAGLVESANGELIALGLAPGKIELAAFNTAGTLDSGFGANGLVESVADEVGDLSSEMWFQAVASPDAGVVIAESGSGQKLLRRYTSSGALDATFGDGGIVRLAGSSVVDSSRYLERIDAVAVGSDGSILIGDDVEAIFGPPTREVLFRLTNDGKLDEGFAPGGMLVTRIPAATEDQTPAVQAQITILRDQSFLVSGPAKYGGVLIERFDESGTAVTSFGRRGLKLYHPFSDEIIGNVSVTTAPDGSVAVTDEALWGLRRIQQGADVTTLVNHTYKTSYLTEEGNRKKGRRTTTLRVLNSRNPTSVFVATAFDPNGSLFVQTRDGTFKVNG